MRILWAKTRFDSQTKDFDVTVICFVSRFVLGVEPSFRNKYTNMTAVRIPTNIPIEGWILGCMAGVEPGS